MGMNPERPHEIRQFNSADELREAGYVPISSRMATELKDATEEERARFLAALRSKMIDMARTAAIAEKVRDRLQAAVDPAIDKMDEGAPDKENVPLILGVLVGCRAWLGSFEALEDSLVPSLLEAGIDRERYESMKIAAAAEGIRGVELVRRLVDEDER